MSDLSARLRAVCDLELAEAREYSGRHEYDGVVHDLSPDGVRGALARLAAHVNQAAATGDPDPALGGTALAALMSSAERIEVDLGRLAERADAERDRLAARLAESCARIGPGRPALTVARELVRDHPGPEGVLDAARHWTERA